jgi:hypothetical protein
LTYTLRAFRPTALALVLALTATSLGETTKTVPIEPTALHGKLVKRGIGKSVKVTQLDGTVVKGTLVSIDADSFAVTPKGATQPVHIANGQVAKFENGGISTATKWAIGIAIFAALAIGSSRV